MWLFWMYHRQSGSKPQSIASQIASNPSWVRSFAENYPPPAHNRNSEPMSNIAHDLVHHAAHPAQVFVPQCKSSVFALFARIHLPQAMQRTRIFRGIINRKAFCNNDLRVNLFPMVRIHRFPNLPRFPLHRFPNFLWFADVSFLTSSSELYRSPRNASI